MTRTEKTHRMFSLVEAWKDSSQTREAFCRQHGVKLSTFDYWTAKKKRADQSETSFLPVTTCDGGAEEPVTITYPNGVSLTVTRPTTELVARLVKAW